MELWIADQDIQIGMTLRRYVMGAKGQPAEMMKMVVVSLDDDVITCHATDLPPTREAITALNEKLALGIDPESMDNTATPEWTFCRKTGIEIDEDLGFGPTTMVATWVTPHEYKAEVKEEKKRTPYTKEQRDKLLEALSTAPDSFLDATMAKRCGEMVGMSDEEFRPAMHEVLDRCVFSALASDAMIVIMSAIWRDAGGSPSDPAPWRDNL